MNSRIFKFRAFDQADSEMVYAENPRDIFPLDPENTNFVMMQYTGLKDKNGREIYEGDICVVTGQNYEYAFHIYWDDESAGYYDHRIDTDQDWLRWDEISVDKLHLVRVIGNIYENPELLKVSQ